MAACRNLEREGGAPAGWREDVVLIATEDGLVVEIEPVDDEGGDDDA